jgi:hypothetical protein
MNLAFLTLMLSILILGSPAGSQGQGRRKNPGRPPASTSPPKAFGDEISGMYTFLREGEFVQLTVEKGKVSGFVSRYGERESDKDAFLDQFFSKGALEGKRISFTTKPIHGTWFEFDGTVSRGETKSPDKEGYWILRGTLHQYDEDETKHVSARSRQVTLKSFPQDLNDNPEPK